MAERYTFQDQFVKECFLLCPTKLKTTEKSIIQIRDVVKPLFSGNQSLNQPLCSCSVLSPNKMENKIITSLLLSDIKKKKIKILQTND